MGTIEKISRVVLQMTSFVFETIGLLFCLMLLAGRFESLVINAEKYWVIVAIALCAGFALTARLVCNKKAKE